MKDMYELLNDINIDEDEFEEMEVSDLERAKVKTSLKKSIKKNKMKVWKKSAMAAAIIASLSVATIGLTFPTYASSIPVVADIFRFLDNGRTGLYDEYKEYSTEMNMTKESNGIKVTINDAIFDGETVSVTYTIESDKDLGKDPIIFDNLDIKGSMGMSGSSRISKVDKNHYVGFSRTTPHFNRTDEDTVKVKWNIDRIIIQGKKEEIKGNWNFAFALNSTDSKMQLVGRSAERDGVKVNIEKLSVTPMSFIVYYDQAISEKVRSKWDDVEVNLEIKDNIGNSYFGEGNGGMGKDSYNLSWSKTFGILDPKATNLIVTPHITLRNYNSDNHGGVEITKNGEKEIVTPTRSGGKNEEFVLEDIIIELKN